MNKKIITWVSILIVIIAAFLLTLGLVGFNAHGAEFFFKKVLLDNFLAVNALLLGFLTLVGYLILGRSISGSIVGALKTIIGVLLLSIGAGMLVGLAKPIFQGLTQISHSTKVTPIDPYLGWSSCNGFLKNGITTGFNYVSWVSFALIIGFFINILLIVFKKWTNVHSLMVTGHIMFQQTAIVTAAVFLFLFSGFQTISGGQEVNASNQVGTIVTSGLLVGIYWGVGSTSTIRGTQKVTNNAGFAVGHQQMFGAALAYKFGKYFGNVKDSAETKKLSNKIKIFEDNIFTQSLIILILFFILIMIIQFSTASGFNPTVKGSAYGSWKIGGDAVWVINMFLGAFKIIASILALVSGVRMFVTELQQAFQGISQKVIPGAIVAVDCAATYGFSPNSVTYGFIAGVIAQFTAVGIILGISIATGGSMPIVIPLFITLFFNSGTIAIFANASGGYKAAIIIPAIMGFVELFVASGAIAIFGHAYDHAREAGNVVNQAIDKDTGKAINGSPVALGYIGMADWNLIWGLVFAISGSSHYVAWIMMPVYAVIMLLIAQLVDSSLQKKQTLLQKLFNIKPKILNNDNEKLEEAK